MREEFEDFASQLDVTDVQFIPISALLGDNVVEPSINMPWYDGPTLMTKLETVHIGNDVNHLQVITNDPGEKNREDHAFYIAVIG